MYGAGIEGVRASGVVHNAFLESRGIVTTKEDVVVVLSSITTNTAGLDEFEASIMEREVDGESVLDKEPLGSCSFQIWREFFGFGSRCQGCFLDCGCMQW